MQVFFSREKGRKKIPPFPSRSTYLPTYHFPNFMLLWTAARQVGSGRGGATGEGLPPPFLHPSVPPPPRGVIFWTTWQGGGSVVCVQILREVAQFPNFDDLPLFPPKSAPCNLALKEADLKRRRIKTTSTWEWHNNVGCRLFRGPKQICSPGFPGGLFYSHLGYIHVALVLLAKNKCMNIWLSSG